MQVEDYLQSNDIEMVQLGATLLQQVSPRDWGRILMMNLNKKFRFWIEDREIHIIPVIPGLWEQLDTGYKYIYDSSELSVDIMEEVVENFLNKSTYEK